MKEKQKDMPSLPAQAVAHQISEAALHAVYEG
jgi:hypothetical protein